jgi:SlyX protein
MSDERLVDIETKLAHQDHLLIELNDVITDQQDRIMKLEELCSSLVDRVRSIGDSMPGEASQEEPPPHY